MVLRNTPSNGYLSYIIFLRSDKMANKSPLRYPGGKYKTYKFIESLVRENNCSTYIEPFAGGAAVALSLLLEGNVKKIIINDYDKSIFAFWYSVLNYTNEIISLINCTDVNMDEWYRQKSIQENKENSTLLELGFSTLFLNRTNRSGIIKGGVIGGKKQEGDYKMDCRFPKDKLIEKIQLIAKHKKYIELYNLDAIVFIDKVIKKTRNSFTFFDPPYYLKGPSLYVNFYSHNDHLLLSEKITKELKNRKWLVTYDNSAEIKSMYSNLNYIEYYLNYTAQNKKKGIEYMFFSKKTLKENPQEYLKVIS